MGEMFRWGILQCKIPADEETLDLLKTSVCCPKFFRSSCPATPAYNQRQSQFRSLTKVDDKVEVVHPRGCMSGNACICVNMVGALLSSRSRGPPKALPGPTRLLGRIDTSDTIYLYVAVRLRCDFEVRGKYGYGFQRYMGHGATSLEALPLPRTLRKTTIFFKRDTMRIDKLSHEGTQPHSKCQRDRPVRGSSH
ncbi:hypothetical protein BDP67DRAFT_488311 [Colletotrichum lupini]|nr:hypothetical protein BDP67DRAFT_488311 [Colletotrichum lupini]